MEKKNQPLKDRPSIGRVIFMYLYTVLYTCLTLRSDYLVIKKPKKIFSIVYLGIIAFLSSCTNMYKIIEYSHIWKLITMLTNNKDSSSTIINIISTLSFFIIVFIAMSLASYIMMYIMSKVLKTELDIKEFNMIAISMTYHLFLSILRLVFVNSRYFIIYFEKDNFFNMTGLFVFTFFIQNYYYSKFEFSRTFDRFILHLLSFLVYILIDYIFKNDKLANNLYFYIYIKIKDL